MTISDLYRMRASQILQTDDPLELPQIQFPDADRRQNFQNAFTYAVDQVDMAQSEAGQEVEAFIAGEQENLHEVMIRLNQAKTSFQLMVEVRNKMMDAYQELIRMQI